MIINSILYTKANSQNPNISEHKNKSEFIDFPLPVPKVAILRVSIHYAKFSWIKKHSSNANINSKHRFYIYLISYLSLLLLLQKKAGNGKYPHYKILTKDTDLFKQFRKGRGLRKTPEMRKAVFTVSTEATDWEPSLAHPAEDTPLVLFMHMCSICFTREATNTPLPTKLVRSIQGRTLFGTFISPPKRSQFKYTHKHLWLQGQYSVQMLLITVLPWLSQVWKRILQVYICIYKCNLQFLSSLQVIT